MAVMQQAVCCLGMFLALLLTDTLQAKLATCTRETCRSHAAPRPCAAQVILAHGAEGNRHLNIQGEVKAFTGCWFSGGTMPCGRSLMYITSASRCLWCCSLHSHAFDYPMRPACTSHGCMHEIQACIRLRAINLPQFGVISVTLPNA